MARDPLAGLDRAADPDHGAIHSRRRVDFPWATSSRIHGSGDPAIPRQTNSPAPHRSIAIEKTTGDARISGWIWAERC